MSWTKPKLRLSSLLNFSVKILAEILSVRIVDFIGSSCVQYLLTALCNYILKIRAQTDKNDVNYVSTESIYIYLLISLMKFECIHLLYRCMLLSSAEIDYSLYIS